MDMHTNTTPYGIRIGPRVSGRVTLHAGLSGASPLRIPMPPQPLTPIRRSIKATGLYRSYCPASGVLPADKTDSVHVYKSITLRSEELYAGSHRRRRRSSNCG